MILGACRAPPHPQSFCTIHPVRQKEKLRLRGTSDRPKARSDAAQGSRLQNQPSHPSPTNRRVSPVLWDLLSESPDSLSAFSPSRAPTPSSCSSCHIKLDHSHSSQSERHHFWGPEEEIPGEHPVVYKPSRTTTRPVPTSFKGLSLHQLPLLKLE